MTETLHIIGGGMAGAEAAWQAAQHGHPRGHPRNAPQVGTFAHRTGSLAEMVCSNSFRSDDDERNAVGLLHWEMGAADGIIMQTARAHRLPAGGALAVDRDPFAEAVTARLHAHPLITVEPGEITELAHDRPLDHRHRPPHLTALAESIRATTGARQPCLLRCHRPHRLCRVGRHVGRLDAIAL
jgi:methylenetetrahydrofolate--tRNA-(uracil-5-)-methyltransferase